MIFSGHAAYGNAVSLGKKEVESSYFMTYHTILKTSTDYINALKNAQRIAKNITNTINENLDKKQQIQVFPYR